MLFLQILATADYFSANRTLMEHVPPVYVDIILDPYLFGVLPRSLAPTAGYVVVVAVMSWHAARWIGAWLRTTTSGGKKDQ